MSNRSIYLKLLRALVEDSGTHFAADLARANNVSVGAAIANLDCLVTDGFARAELSDEFASSPRTGSVVRRVSYALVPDRSEDAQRMVQELKESEVSRVRRGVRVRPGRMAPQFKITT